MRLTPALVSAVALCQLACDRSSSHDTRESARAETNVSAYLQPVFHSLDSLLSGQQRDSLRHVTLDSGFTFRAWQLTEVAKPLVAGWMRSPIVDSIIAHGEKAYMTPEIVLDLYHQHLRGESLSLGGALRRVSPEYVDSILPHTISVDSVLLEKDIDGNNIPDHLVREARRRPVEVPVQDRDGTAGVDTISFAEYRLALYLNARPASSNIPAWMASFDDVNDGELVKAIPLASGGTVLVIDVSYADAVETVMLLAWQGQAQEILRHQIDYGEGDFKLHDSDGRVAVDVTGDVQLGSRTVRPTGQCAAPRSWPGSTLVYNDTTKQFVVERSICIPRTEQ
jgi:hypothetical protein